MRRSGRIAFWAVRRVLHLCPRGHGALISRSSPNIGSKFWFNLVGAAILTNALLVLTRRQFNRP